ncbi:transposase family protein [Bradyrhizobium sp. CNPSo 4016]|nr:DDE-type integrase/transposase/recombinase [Bradyrhizobium glycinis]MBH5373156.1 transposase family protein [Bradyrhizobium glycinis]
MVIDRPNQVWAADITYVPIGQGFLYLVAIIVGRAVRCRPGACRTRWTHRSACPRSKRALARFGRPEIFNTDQGSQFTSAAFTGTLAAAGVRISMDGRDRWMDDVFIERLWRSLKYEDIYLKRTSISRGIRMATRPKPESPDGWSFTISNALIRRWKTARRGRSGAIGAFGEEAVDMTLLASEKLGHAARCPHPHSHNSSKP